MRDRLPMVWRNLILLYLGIFLTMTGWGAAHSLVDRWTWPVASVNAPRRPTPAWSELLGFWRPGRILWQRLLELTIPGLARATPRQLTHIPVGSAGSRSPWPVWPWPPSSWRDSAA
mgnify:CR=1 FL=1